MKSIQTVKKVIDSSLDERNSMPANIYSRKDGINFQKYLEVERENKIMLAKMTNIMQGNYASSTKTTFYSSKSTFLIFKSNSTLAVSTNARTRLSKIK